MKSITAQKSMINDPWKKKKGGGSLRLLNLNLFCNKFLVFLHTGKIRVNWSVLIFQVNDVVQ